MTTRAAVISVVVLAACAQPPMPEPEVDALEILGKDGWLLLANANVEAPLGFVSLRNNGPKARAIVPEVTQGTSACNPLTEFELGPGELASIRPRCFFELKIMQLRITSGSSVGTARVTFPPIVSNPVFPDPTMPGMPDPLECAVVGPPSPMFATFGGVAPGGVASQSIPIFRNDARCQLEFELPDAGPFSVRNVGGSVSVEFRPTEWGTQSFGELTIKATPRFVGEPFRVLLNGTSAPLCPSETRTCPTVERDTIYLSTFDALFRIGPNDQTAQRVGPFRDAETGRGVPVRDLAVLPDGRLVAIAGWLFEVDPTTGWMRELFPVGSPSAIDTLPDGRMVIGNTGASILTQTGHVTVLSSSVQLSGDFAVAPDDRVFATIRSGNTDTLATLDLATGAFQTVGPLAEYDVWALTFRGASLEGFTGHGTRIVIDPQTGATLSNTSVPGEWTGAAVWH